MIRSLSFTRALSIAAVALLSSACADDKRAPTAPTTVEKPEPVLGTTAYLTISDSAPERGKVITVSGYATGKDARFGSFAARLTFLPAGFTYVGEEASSAGMRAVNAKLGDVAIAGINLEGFEDGHLFSIQLRVDNPAALGSLELSMSELTTVEYRNERASLSIQKAVRVARIQ